MFLPKEYLSQATIGVAAPTLSGELLRGVSSLDKEERQRAISQQLLSSTVLQRVVREEKIDPDKPVDESASWLRANVSQNISVPQPIGKQTDNQKGPDSFILGYTDSDPQRAQRIANRLAYVFAEENSKQQLERSENTSEILSQQLQASQARLSRLEGQLREKKQAYMGRLPDQVNANVQMVNGLRSQLESISTAASRRTGSALDGGDADRADEAGQRRRSVHELRRGRGAGGAEAHQRSAAAARSGARSGIHRQAPGGHHAAGGAQARDGGARRRARRPTADPTRCRPIRCIGKSSRSATRRG